MNGAITPDDKPLELLFAHDRTDAAGAVRTIHHHVGHRHAVFTGRADDTDACVGPGFLSKNRCGTVCSLTPSGRCISEFHLVVVDVQIGGLGAFALNNHKVPAGKLKLMSQFTANVGTRNERLRISSGPKRRNGCASRTNSARTRERSRCNHKLVFRVITRCLRVNLFPKNLIADGGAADIVLKTREGIFNFHFLRGEIDSKTLARVTAKFFRHNKKPFV